MSWDIGPPDLPYSTFDESLQQLNFVTRDIILSPEGNVTFEGLRRFFTTVTREDVGEGVNIGDAVVSFDRNASGSVTYTVLPTTDPLMANALLFDVSFANY